MVLTLQLRPLVSLTLPVFTSFLGNFNVLDSQSFSDATAAGFFGAGNQ